MNPLRGLHVEQKVVWFICVFWVLCAPWEIHLIRTEHPDAWLALLLSLVCFCLILDSFRINGHWYRGKD